MNILGRCMRVLHVIQGLGVKSGGPNVSVRALAAAQAAMGNDVRILTRTDGDDSASQGADNNTTVEMIQAESGRWRWWFAAPPKLAQEVKRSDIVHVAALWEELPHAALREAMKQDVPSVISPRGMLEPWALNYRKWKKRLAMALYQRPDLDRASCLHALCDAEARNFRALNLTNPIAVVPNGIDLSPFEDMPARSRLEQFFPPLTGRRLLLFLGRIHQKKGLPHTVGAWVSLARQFPEWDLVIAGCDEHGQEAQIRTLIRSLGVLHRVHFTGTVKGERKYSLLANSEMFVLSSFSEGFSMAILEAMASRLPVLLTPGCNFPEAAQAGAAVSVEPNDASTAAGLNKVLSMSDGERREMGERGRALVERDYTWDRIAAKMLETYEWVLGQKPRPDWVREA